MSRIPDIKLIRTDTTLDLSQKAEKNTAPKQGAEDANRRIYKHIRLWRRPSWQPHSRRHARRRSTPPSTHETPDHATLHPRTTHPNMASGCPRQPRPPLQLRLLFLIVYAPGAHGTEEEAEWDQGVSHGTRPLATGWSLRLARCPTGSTGSPPDLAMGVPRRQRHALPRRHVKEIC